MLYYRSNLNFFFFVSHDNSSSLPKEIGNTIEGIEKLRIQGSDNPKPYLNMKDPAKFFIQGVLKQKCRSHFTGRNSPGPRPLPFLFFFFLVNRTWNFLLLITLPELSIGSAFEQIPFLNTCCLQYYSIYIHRIVKKSV